ncbi:cobalt-precorrin-6A reductase [Rhizobium sp. S152]|uniref:cobalt-precorrin-6A reductase n=1 Tax=Rhizobium sp. S152 TaxID=3055038 RepID=UPI0025A932F6|nr:cobalt-precorrin-6A reductase [Rhizobium sp. S152]MDM9624863.1 cobalt-precorrin-6A reductase [Rhizobium sp. S152]
MGSIRILMLGGTAEARILAQALADRGHGVLLSLAGRTDTPAAQPVPTRTGGFGGAEGLADFLKQEAFDLLIDATHPFAARISRNASEAAAKFDIPALALRRPQWIEQAGDRWTHVATAAQAITQIGAAPRRVFLAIGRQEAHVAEVAPQHFYLVRSVDPVDPPLRLPNVQCLLDRGPFDVEREAVLLESNYIDVVIAKNSGGAATYGKIEAARRLGLDVIMIARAPATAMQTVTTVDAALDAIDHLFPPEMNRGV